eukprot:COSAG02_NODE_45038_length_360_cov_172.758621_1_plen_85_part_01
MAEEEGEPEFEQSFASVLEEGLVGGGSAAVCESQFDPGTTDREHAKDLPGRQAKVKQRWRFEGRRVGDTKQEWRFEGRLTKMRIR